MKLKHWILAISLVLVCVASALTFSHHGLIDLRKLSGQISTVKERIVLIEEENKRLKHQADLLEKPTAEILERHVRTTLGWVKPNERVFIESSGNP
jgi:cell division protein FtsB